MTGLAKKLIALLIAATLPFALALTAFCEKQPDGSVKLLPERLVVLDDSGRSVSDNGEYYFVVEGMEQDKTYTKLIQIMNLREDASYRISMQAFPLSNKGEINLEEECSCEILLGTRVVYTGKITGEGEPDMNSEPLDLGAFAPGDSRTMMVNIKWNGTKAGGEIDNGHTLVYPGGVEVIREPSGKDHISGEVEFRWVFTAQGDVVNNDESNPNGNDEEVNKPGSSPDGGGNISNASNVPATSSKPGISTITSFVKTGGVIAIGFLVIIMMATLALIVMLSKKKNRKT